LGYIVLRMTTVHTEEECDDKGNPLPKE